MAKRISMNKMTVEQRKLFTEHNMKEINDYIDMRKLDFKTALYMGIDQSTTSSGIIILDWKGKIVLERLIKYNSNTINNTDMRLVWLHQEFLNVMLDERFLNICLVGYELPSATRPAQAHLMGETAFTIKLACWKTDLPYITIAPQRIKKYVAATKSEGVKSLVMKNVYKQYDYDVNDDNLADAFVIAQITKELVRFAINGKCFASLKDYQKSVIKDTIPNNGLCIDMIDKKKVRILP